MLLRYLKFTLFFTIFLSLIECSCSMNSLSTPHYPEEIPNEDREFSLNAELIYDLGDVNVIDAKIDNSNLYLAFNNIYSGNISSWGHLCLINLKNIKNIKRSNVLYRPETIEGIIDNTLFLNCSHDILPFDKKSLLRKTFFIPGDPEIVHLNDKKIYFMTSPPAILFCAQRINPKIQWKFEEDDNYKLLPYVYELNGKVFLIASKLSQPISDTVNYNLYVIVLDAYNGKELRRQLLSINSMQYEVLNFQNEFCSFKDDQMLVLLKRRTNIYRIISYEINTEGTIKEAWQKEFKISSSLFSSNKNKDIFIGLHNSSKLVIDDLYIYIPYQETLGKEESSRKIIKKSLFALDRKTGKLMWKCNFSDSGRFENFLKVYNSNKKGKIIISTFDLEAVNSSTTFFYCLDQQNGNLIWQNKFDSFYYSINSTEDILWFIGKDNEKQSLILRAINTNKGITLGSFEPKDAKIYNVYYSDNVILPYGKDEAIYVCGNGRIYNIKLTEKQ